MHWIYVLDLFGTFIFAISGVLTAMQKRFDLVGTLIIGFVTAVGGGTLRDIMIGRLPVGWLQDRYYLLAIFCGYLVAYFLKDQVLKLKKSMFFFDTLGIGLFTILGVQIALHQGLNPEIAIMMGAISACFGGVIRDVLTNEIPLVFRKEIYLSACLLGGLIYLLLAKYSNTDNLNILVSILVIIAVRYLSIRYHWSLNLPSRQI